MIGAAPAVPLWYDLATMSHHPRKVRGLLALPLAAGAALALIAVAGEGSAVERGDAAWARRAEGHRGDRAAAGPIGEAVAAYQEALAADPGSLRATWRLLRALYFQGDYATAERDAKAAIYDRGKEACGRAVDRLRREVPGFEGVEDAGPASLRTFLGRRPDAARLFFWCAVNWGLWGENHGKLAAARAGVAARVRDFTLAAIALDKRYEAGGGHRILGRLHSEAPKLPLVTGWVSRDTAIAELRRAVEIGPEEPINRIFLAEALLDHGGQARQAEAWAILGDLAELAPRAESAVEDSRVKRLAREQLENRRR